MLKKRYERRGKIYRREETRTDREGFIYVLTSCLYNEPLFLPPLSALYIRPLRSRYVMKELDHPFLSRLRYAFQTKEHLYVDDRSTTEHWNIRKEYEKWQGHG